MGGLETYNVNAAVDFGEAAFANVMHTLELAYNVLCGCGGGGRRRRRCR